MTVNTNTIDAILPQTQCGECGFQGCRPYAEALSMGQTTIDKCPPGGVVVLGALAKLLNKDPSPFDEEVRQKTRAPSIAFIREEECIGCTKCISACPVDAILGSGKLMHTVINQECTGCGLCVEPCPVDCIEMLPLDEPLFNKDLARKRFNAAKDRRSQVDSPIPKSSSLESKQQYILEALARMRDKQS